MKIICDVCGAAEAAVFCCADEAALCSPCDRRIHCANKLADKHSRFPLLYSSSSQPRPLCDVCQERQGFVFCKEDRAILCLECDRPIHANKRLTMTHSRFIITGARLSSTPVGALSPSSELRKEASGSFSATAEFCSSSSISDYLLKMLPGYLVEDLLVDDSMDQVAGKGDDMLPFVEGNLDIGYIGGLPEADWSFCVPDAPPQILPNTMLSAAAGSDRGTVEHVEGFVYMAGRNAPEVAVPPVVAGAKRRGVDERGANDIFTVPQLLSVAGSNKRPCRPSALYF